MSSKYRTGKSNKNSFNRVLGIDPGYEKVGIAVVERDNKGKEVLIFSDCIVTKRTLPHHERLLSIGKGVTEVIKKYKPTVLAIEKLFFNENQKTAMSVSEARGVILFVASQNKLKVREFTPLEIKVATTGYGRADKKQMRMMVEKLIALPMPIKHDDEYDAIATAITCFATTNRDT